MHAASQIRRLTAADVDLLRQLNAMFAAAFDDEHAYTGAPPDEAYCRRTLGKDDVIVLVALKEASVVGGLVAYELDKLERTRREIYIYDLAVAESHRRQGIATRLIERLRAIAHERGAWSCSCRRTAATSQPLRSTRSWVCARRCCISICPYPERTRGGQVHRINDRVPTDSRSSRRGNEMTAVRTSGSGAQLARSPDVADRP